jgi:hypothetical protein
MQRCQLLLSGCEPLGPRACSSGCAPASRPNVHHCIAKACCLPPAPTPHPPIRHANSPKPHPAALPQVLLLEAYEQLERDVGKEVDRALGAQGEELQRLGRRAAFLEEQLEGERQQVAALQQQGAELQEQLGEAQGRCAAYEAGVYGLPQVGGWGPGGFGGGRGAEGGWWRRPPACLRRCVSRPWLQAGCCRGAPLHASLQPADLQPLPPAALPAGGDGDQAVARRHPDRAAARQGPGGAAQPGAGGAGGRAGRGGRAAAAPGPAPRRRAGPGQGQAAEGGGHRAAAQPQRPAGAPGGRG